MKEIKKEKSMKNVIIISNQYGHIEKGAIHYLFMQNILKKIPLMKK